MLNSLQITLILLIILSLLGYLTKSKNNDFSENFDNFSKYTLKEDVDKIYNSFYSNIYDELFNSATKNQFEIYNINMYTISDKKDFTKNEINFLDIGCGTGNHVKIIQSYKYNVVGLDNSKKMLIKARQDNETSSLVKGDFHNKEIFRNREFTHVTCFFFTIYYSNNVKQVFENINFWLKPKGLFCLHLVNKNTFDPVLEKASSLIPLFNPQKHSHDRQTKSKLTFNKFNYLSEWYFSKKDTVFEENFLFKDNSKHIKHRHKLYIRNIPYYTKLAEKTGFTLIKIIDLTPVNHDNNYIYIFQKKYGD